VIVPLVVDVTDAVNFTLCPLVAGFGADVSVVVVVAFEDAFTICGRPDEFAGA
jgi:hypothetical protein